jgi:hypothetical protein
VVVGLNAIPSLVVLDTAPQKVPPLIQNEHKDAMEDNEWAHEGSKWCCKVDACISSYVAKWLIRKHLSEHTHFKYKMGNQGCPSIRPRGLRQKDHESMNACILNNPHARQKWNEKKAFD